MKYKIKEFMKADISKFYILGVSIICLLLLGGFFSYAMFTVSKERDNAISIETGNLVYDLKVDGTKGSTLTVPEGATKEFIVTLSNPNNRVARFNFYYEGDLPSDVTVGYEVSDGINTPPEAKGTNLSQADSAGSSNTYLIKVSNNSNSGVTINLGVGVGLDYNDLELPNNGHLFEEMQYQTVSEKLLTSNLGNGSTYDDGVDTFITGEDPNNYIWYSGKLWQAVSVNNAAKTTKLISENNISALNYSSGSSTFAGSYMEEWLNDTSVDGFLGNLRDYENFIVTDSVWDATMDDRALGSITRPSGTTTVNNAVGLLNLYEYQSSYNRATIDDSYIDTENYWWSLTPASASEVWVLGDQDAYKYDTASFYGSGVRPSINLKSSVEIVSGDGTKSNPYRLRGDNDTNLSGTLLNTRYSGEYVQFGENSNNLYRIVSHETKGLTKIVSIDNLRDSSNDGIYLAFDSSGNVNYSTSTTIGNFLNGEYLSNYVGPTYNNMIADNSTWYLGTVSDGQSYKLAKYTDVDGVKTTANTTKAKVGLLRMGELMSGQGYGDYLDIYWLLTIYSSTRVAIVYDFGDFDYERVTRLNAIKPALNLKSNVIITSGDGTKNNPFTIELGN